MAARKLAFIPAATDHRPMILNRLDYCRTADGADYDVGLHILRTGSYARTDTDLLFNLLTAIVALDRGANIGVHAVDLARRMTGWGQIVAIEAQERLFYALAGNIALNNCDNARAMWAAVTAVPGPILVPAPDYHAPGRFDSLEPRPSAALVSQG